MAAGINMAKMMRMTPALLVLLATLNIVVVSSIQTTDHEIHKGIESTSVTAAATSRRRRTRRNTRRRRRSSVECLCSPRSYVFRIPKFLSLPSGEYSCDAHNNNNNNNADNNTINKSKEGISDSLCIHFPLGDNIASDTTMMTTIETTSLSFFEFSTSLNSTIIHQLSSSFAEDDDDYDDEMDYHLVEFPSASRNLDPSLPLTEQDVPGGVMLLLTGRIGGRDDGSAATINVQSTIAWNYDGRECRVEPVGVGDSIGWLIVVSAACVFSVYFILFYFILLETRPAFLHDQEECTPAIPDFCPATAATVAEMEEQRDDDDDALEIFYSKSSKAAKSHGGHTIGGDDGGGKSNKENGKSDKRESGKSKSGKSHANHRSHKSGGENGGGGKSGKSGR
mmetsp:Transcript_5362/g.10908  ORF Transcript_5362/g.10908 Transcript_5362/m.10908 type:complete len:394 (+) Transcript_5362:222-1403(+)